MTIVNTEYASRSAYLTSPTTSADDFFVGIQNTAIDLVIRVPVIVELVIGIMAFYKFRNLPPEPVLEYQPSKNVTEDQM